MFKLYYDSIRLKFAEILLFPFFFFWFVVMSCRFLYKSCIHCHGNYALTNNFSCLGIFAVCKKDLSHGSKLGTTKKKSNWKVLWKCCDLIDEKSSACGEEEYNAGKNDETQNMMGAAIAILPGNTTSVCDPYPAEHMAAIRIQTAFRGFLV